MPNKTIYVADDDLPLFTRAQELVGGNLSGAVVTALRRFIELEEGKQEGFDEIILRVGRDGIRQVRFSGSLLGEWREENEKHVEHIRIYRSRKGKFVMHTQRSEWAEYPSSSNWLADLKDWRKMLGISQDWGDFTLEIVDSLTQLKGKIPDKLYSRVTDIADRPTIEELDI